MSAQRTVTDRRKTRWSRSGPIIAVWLLFAAYVGVLTPDVNESHYLTKAKHFWDPDWCSGDLFLSSEYSHWLFYASTGWVTQFVSLELYAVGGRILTCLLLAVAWQYFLKAFTDSRWLSIASAGLSIVLVEQGNLAGEWFVGGFEAKGIAYALVIASLGAASRGRWEFCWPLLGLAAGFHFLVGFWATVALLASGLWCGFATLHPDKRVSPISAAGPATRWRHAALAALGLVLALPGLLPPLISRLGVSDAPVVEAAQVQVFYRLAHHLYFPAFETTRVASFAVMLVIWGLVYRATADTEVLRPLAHFATAAVILDVVGVVLSALAGEANPFANVACMLLRLYWFRLADVALPLHIAVGLTWMAHVEMFRGRRKRWSQTGITLVLLIASAAFVVVIFDRWSSAVPRGDRAAMSSYSGDPEKSYQAYENWRAVCQWIRLNTPKEAVFLTPPLQQSFKWHAHRSEVFSWKDMPQDDQRILEWWRRAEDVYWGPRDWTDGWFAFSDDELRELAIRYGARYLLLTQRDYERRASELVRLYPIDPASRSTFVVLQLD